MICSSHRPAEVHLVEEMLPRLRAAVLLEAYRMRKPARHAPDCAGACSNGGGSSADDNARSSSGSRAAWKNSRPDIVEVWWQRGGGRGDGGERSANKLRSASL